MNDVCGIVLAGGLGSRLWPMTRAISKQLLPIYDKPMIYYPISTLMLLGIQEILLITDPQNLSLYKKLLGNGSGWGIHIEYCVQESPAGLPEAYILAEEFIDGRFSALILGDNIFYLSDHDQVFKNPIIRRENTCFATHVQDPERYGVVVLGDNNEVTDIVEKPSTKISNYAVLGLYLLDHRASKFSKELKPSARGELEIVDLLKKYLAVAELNCEILGRGITWLDAGTPAALDEASTFMSMIEYRKGLKIGCPEEIALRNQLISLSQFDELINQATGEYAEYLQRVRDELK